MKPKLKGLITLGIFLTVITVIVWNVKLVGENSAGVNKYNLNEKYYIPYTFRSEGILKPKINDIELLDDDYNHIPEENKYFGYGFCIDENPKTAMSSFYDEDFKKFEGYKIDNRELTVVLAINFRNEIDKDFSPYIKITYNILGIKRSVLKKITFINSAHISD